MIKSVKKHSFEQTGQHNRQKYIQESENHYTIISPFLKLFLMYVL